MAWVDRKGTSRFVSEKVDCQNGAIAINSFWGVSCSQARPRRTPVIIYARFEMTFAVCHARTIYKNAGEQMLIYQFLTELLTVMCWQLHETGEMKELTKVEEWVCLLMMIDNHDSLQSVTATGTTAAEPQVNMSCLTQQIAALATQKSAHSRNHGDSLTAMA